MKPGRALLMAIRSSVSSGDPHFANVSILLHMDGANGSSTFTDVTGKTVANGGALISNLHPAFGSGCGEFITNFPHTSASADFNFGTGDFTIQWWEYVTTLAGF
jgi:hypothetical protein